MSDDIRITDLDKERTRRTIAKLEAAPDVTEAWHRMAEPLTDPEADAWTPHGGSGAGWRSCSERGWRGAGHRGVVLMKYRTIVADPPWRYQNARGTQTRCRAGRSQTVAEGNYPTMSADEIAALPVAALAERDCALYLWVTNPLLFEGRAIVEAWGFKYVTLLTWVKTGAPGLGFSFRGHTEHAIYATRGDVRIPPERRESNVITAPRRAHSQKPEAFYDLVERVSEPPYLEMFARDHHRFFWDVWGNESANTATIEAVS